MCGIFKYLCCYEMDEDEENESLLSKEYVHSNIASIRENFTKNIENFRESFTEISGKMDEELKTVQEIVQDNNENVDAEIHYLKLRVSKLERMFDGLKQVLVFKEFD